MNKWRGGIAGAEVLRGPGIPRIDRRPRTGLRKLRPVRANRALPSPLPPRPPADTQTPPKSNTWLGTPLLTVLAPLLCRWPAAHENPVTIGIPTHATEALRRDSEASAPATRGVCVTDPGEISRWSSAAPTTGSRSNGMCRPRRDRRISSRGRFLRPFQGRCMLGRAGLPGVSAALDPRLISGTPSESGTDPGGVGDISRWSSAAPTTGSRSNGMCRSRRDRSISPPGRLLRPFQGRCMLGGAGLPGVSAALDPRLISGTPSESSTDPGAVGDVG